MRAVFPIKSILIWSFFSLVVACGGSGDSSDDASELENDDDTVNTNKLIGTPFEGKTTGDDFDWDFFLCNQYRTETIDELPIQIFTAFFTESEEETIQEGIDVANEAMGPTDDGGVFYEMTDTWSDEVRVIYKVSSIIDENGNERDVVGHAGEVEVRFNDKMYSERVTPDWWIELKADTGINKWVVAHELGHASALRHYLIDYENDSFSAELLEEGSLMEASPPLNPLLNHYNYMMQQQAQIIENHLGERGETGVCTDE